MIAGKNIAALILCAGRSSRMEKFKPMLPPGQENLLEKIVGLYRSVNIEAVMAVLGHEHDRLIPLLDGLNVIWTINVQYDRGMFSSIQAGVQKIGSNCLAFFLHPADIPLVRPDTLKSLINAFQPGMTDVCRPCYEGKHGHPPLISTALAGEITEFASEGGMRAILAKHAERTVDIDCNDPGILMDIDTPEDYEKALKTIS